MLLLGIDTSGPGVAVALHDGARVVAERSSSQERRHAELLAPSIAAVLGECGAGRRDLTDLAVGIGPGPFTGLRAGVVTARVLGLALSLPVHPVCSLDALAGQAVAPELARGHPVTDGSHQGAPVPVRQGWGEFLVATDARRREVYWAAYRLVDGAVTRVSGPGVATPDRVPRDGRPVIGRGVALYPDALGPVPPGMPLDVTGAGVAELAVRRLVAGLPDDGPAPLYLRRPDAAPPGARKRVLR